MTFYTRPTALPLLGTVLALGAQSATAALLDENFDDVTLLPTSASVRTVADILANTPAQLPTGAFALASTLNAADVNVRRADNTLNTTTGNTGFDSFFAPASGANKFLALGDQGGPIGGSPTGGLVGEAFAFTIPFTVTSSVPVNLSFDWAFDGSDTSTNPLQQDRFLVGLVGGSGLNLAGFLSGNPVSLFAQLLLDRTSPGGFGSGHFAQSILAPVGQYQLAFVHLEALNGLTSPTNSAVGIDNVSATVVPVPPALPLLASAVAGVGVVRRRRPAA